MKPRIPLPLLVFLSLTTAAVAHADSGAVAPPIAAVCKECPKPAEAVACKDCPDAAKTASCKSCAEPVREVVACKDCPDAAKKADCKSCAEPVRAVAKVAGMPGCCPGTGTAPEVAAAGNKDCPDCPECAGAKVTVVKGGPEQADSRVRVFHLMEAARHLQMAGLEKEAAGLQVQAERLLEKLDGAKSTGREPAQEEFLGAIEQLHLQINQLGEAVKALAQAGPDRS